MIKSAMIWGAGSGIGKAITAHLLANQWQVIAIVKESQELENQATLIIEAEATNTNSVQNAAMVARSAFGKISLWIYASGESYTPMKNELSAERWQQRLGANLTGAHITTDYSLPILKRDASLIFIGSIAQTAVTNQSEYAWAKSAYEAFVDSLRYEERNRQVILVRPAALGGTKRGKSPTPFPLVDSSPEIIAARILRAYQDGHKGILDLRPSIPGRFYPMTVSP